MATIVLAIPANIFQYFFNKFNEILLHYGQMLIERLFLDDFRQRFSVVNQRLDLISNEIKQISVQLDNQHSRLLKNLYQRQCGIRSSSPALLDLKFNFPVGEENVVTSTNNDYSMSNEQNLLGNFGDPGVQNFQNFYSQTTPIVNSSENTSVTLQMPIGSSIPTQIPPPPPPPPPSSKIFASFVNVPKPQKIEPQQIKPEISERPRNGASHIPSLKEIVDVKSKLKKVIY